MPLHAYRRRLFAGLAGLFVVSQGLFLTAIAFPPPPSSLAYEGAKLLPQLGLVAVGGAIVSYLAFEYQQGSQRAESRRDLQKQTLNTATTAYLDAKRVRRRMRATGVLVGRDGARHVIVSQYDERMNEIVDVQLRFEYLIQEVASSQDSFGAADECVRHLRVVDRALHHVIVEYENNRPMMHDDEQHPLNNLPRFAALIATQAAEEAKYNAGFAPVTSAMWKLRRCVRKDLIDNSALGPTGRVAHAAVEGRYVRQSMSA